MLTYIQALGQAWPNVYAHANGDGSTYESLIWDGGDPLPSKATLDAWINSNTDLTLGAPLVDEIGGMPSYLSSRAGNPLPLLSNSFVFGSTSTTSSGFYLVAPGGNSSNQVGLILPRKANLVSVSLGVNQAISAQTNFGIRVNKSSINYLTFSLPGNSTKITFSDMSYSFNALDEIAIYVNSTQNIIRPVALLEFAWRL